MQNLVYFLYDKAYINITNACTNACKFCVRDIKDDVVGANLWLDNNNVKAQDVIEQIVAAKDKINSCGEIVFCGYGEPLIKFDEVKAVCEYLRKICPKLKSGLIQTDTGILSIKNIVPVLKPLIDSISISLNAQDEETYNKISSPKIENGYQIMLDFAKECVKEDIDTTMSIVTKFREDIYKIDSKNVKKLHTISAQNFA